MMHPSMSSKKYLYIQVIEAQGIVLNPNLCEPFVEIKYNGSVVLHKKATKCHTGVEWWEKTFMFKVKDIEHDWVAVEVRDKAWHMIQSDWIGEIQLKVNTFQDGVIHDNWYRLGKGSHHYSRDPRGFVHLAIQMLPNKTERPFSDPDFHKTSYNDWVEGGMITEGVKEWEPTTTHMEQQDSEKLYNHFELTYPTIEEAEKDIVKNASRIIHDSKYPESEIAQFRKLNRVNCLKRGNFEECVGKKYLIGIDGSDSARAAFESIIKLMDHQKDHLFFVTVRERVISPDNFNERSSVILRHEIWKAAAGIICKYQDILDEQYPTVQYTSVLPEADDAREILCALVRRYKIDTLVIGKHKPHEVQAKSRYFRSFSRYCQGHAKCAVITFGASDSMHTTKEKEEKFQVKTDKQLFAV